MVRKTALLLAVCLVLFTLFVGAIPQKADAAVFSIASSTRFNDDDSAYLSRTPSTATNNKIWTFSGWVKRGELTSGSNEFNIISADDATGGTGTANVTGYIIFGGSSGSALSVGGATSANNGSLITSGLFRDPAAWTHIVVAYDTTQATASDRIKVYANGVRITSFSTETYPNQNGSPVVNSTNLHGIGRNRNDGGRYYDGYMSDFYFVDGQQLTPSFFGAFDSNGFWRPKNYTGTYGTNGFHLPLMGTSTAAGIGIDTSGNNNTWTVNNITTADFVKDSPTNSFATGNPISPGGGTYSKGNLANTGAATSTFFMSSGVWYWEVHAGGSGVSAGLGTLAGAVSTTTTIASGSTVGFLFDADNGILYTAYSASNFTASTTGFTGGRYPIVFGGTNTVNYGQTASPTSTATVLAYRSGSGGYFLYQPTTQGTSGSGSQTFTSDGTFTVPTHDSLTVTVKAAGGGGGGGGGGSHFGCDENSGGTGGTGGTGGNSSFNSSVTGNGGTGGTGGTAGIFGEGNGAAGSNGSNGTASGGDTNTTGGGSAGGTSGNGGGGCQEGVPNGGAGGAGGAGGQSIKTYSAGGLTPGAGVSVVVGAAGTAGTGGATNGGTGGAGTAGSVAITWTTSSSAAVPTYKSLSTANLPTPAIQKPKNYFDAYAYTGTGAATSSTHFGFSPSLVWIKNRTDAASHAIFDSVRGAQKFFSSDSTAAEDTDDTQSLSSFDSAGFSLGTGASTANVNTSAKNYISWVWKESSTSGFDIVTYTGNGANRTIAHSLSSAPEMILVKDRSGANDWAVYHAANTAAPATDYLLLNSTAATVDDDTYWNDTPPTVSVFSLGTNADVNTNNDTYVAYLFDEVSGYSKFGSYTGNGSADGPFVYTGFKPRFIMIKDTTASGWRVFDTARDTYNLSFKYLAPNTTEAENLASNTTDIDILSNGFKIRGDAGTLNTPAAAYIYAAFAEQPFKLSAMPGTSESTTARIIRLWGGVRLRGGTRIF